MIHCRNDKCKNYFEDNCMIEGSPVINEDGKCESIMLGTHEGYVFLELLVTKCQY